MSKISYIVTGSGRIAAVANGSPYTVDSTHPNYKQIKECLKTGDTDLFIQLVDIPKTINSLGEGKVTVVNGVIRYNDREIHNSLAKRIIWMLAEGFEIKPFVTFLENLMQNPSRRAVNELYNWMENNDIPITTDGCWIGYKYLNTATNRLKGEPSDQDILIDVHTGTIRQWKGKVVEMDRNAVDEDWGVDCSQGLHVGSSTYAFSGTVRVLVKVNPKDVVSVPSNETNKCRVCRYEIVDLFKNVYATPVVGPQGESLKELDDGDYEDEEDEFDACEYCGDSDCCGECTDESDQ